MKLGKSAEKILLGGARARIGERNIAYRGLCAEWQRGEKAKDGEQKYNPERESRPS
jgi:hypothetical protein